MKDRYTKEWLQSRGWKYRGSYLMFFEVWSKDRDLILVVRKEEETN